MKPKTEFKLRITQKSQIEQKTPKFRVIKLVGVVEGDDSYQPNYLEVQGVNDIADAIENNIVVDNIVNFKCTIGGRLWTPPNSNKEIVIQNLNVVEFDILNNQNQNNGEIDNSEGSEYKDELPF